jgi:cell division topological specificity factor
MTLIDFIQRLLGREKPSGALARERLQLVLAHDRSDLNPELLEQMRREILEVVQKYVEIDLDSGDVSLETGDRVTALVANLPIRRARPLATPRPAGDSAAAAPESAPSATDGAVTPDGVGDLGEIGAAAADLPTEPVGLNAETAAAMEPGLPG